MPKDIPDNDPAIHYWAQLAVIEQCSLAIVQRAFPLPQPRLVKRMRKATGSERADRHQPQYSPSAHGS
jgi:hypothetical protein